MSGRDCGISVEGSHKETFIQLWGKEFGVDIYVRGIFCTSGICIEKGVLGCASDEDIVARILQKGKSN